MLSPPDERGRIAGFWGKLRVDRSTGRITAWLPLSSHCLDVATVSRRLIEQSVIHQRLRTVLGESLSPIQLDRLAVFAFLHDLGKCNAGFQAKKDSRSREVAGHVTEVLGLFMSERQPDTFRRLLNDMAEWFTSGPEHVDALLLACISHHGRPISASDLARVPGDPTRWWRPTQALDPMRGVEELVAAVRQAIPGAFETAPPIDASAAFQHRFAAW